MKLSAEWHEAVAANRISRKDEISYRSPLARFPALGATR
jgi:hypothetical protein